MLWGNPNIGGRGTKSFVVQNLSGGKTYYFKVRAGNGCQPGDFSNELSATPFGFSVQGQATGFERGVLGAKTSAQGEENPVATASPKQKANPKNPNIPAPILKLILPVLGIIVVFYLLFL
jgi:hypothetical protein